MRRKFSHETEGETDVREGLAKFINKKHPRVETSFDKIKEAASVKQ